MFVVPLTLLLGVMGLPVGGAAETVVVASQVERPKKSATSSPAPAPPLSTRYMSTALPAPVAPGKAMPSPQAPPLPWPMAPGKSLPMAVAPPGSMPIVVASGRPTPP